MEIELQERKYNKNFIFFGCWNEGHCEIGSRKNPLSSLMTTLYYNENKPEFYILAGDNYYPEKVKYKHEPRNQSFKFLNTENLSSGFDCAEQLASLGSDVFVGLGNHDLEEISGILYDYEKFYKFPDGRSLCEIKELLKDKKNPVNDDIIDVLEEAEKADKCRISHLQSLNITKRDVPLTLATPDLSIMLGNKTLILFINSMFFTDKRYMMSDCYNHFGRYGDSQSIIETERQILLNKVIQRRDSGLETKNIIVIGHEPIVSRKNKEGKERIILDDDGISLLVELYQTIPGVENKFYLCADVHNHQYGKVVITPSGSLNLRDYDDLDATPEANPSCDSLEIQQFVVGTGGTELDKCAPNETEFTRVNSPMFHVDYIMNLCEKKHGFLNCEINENDEMTFLFNTIESSDIAAKRKKSKKKKKKKRKFSIKKHKYIGRV